MFIITPVVRNLLIINIGVFLLMVALRIDLGAMLGLRYWLADTFQPYQFFTHMFLHANFMHLFSNMFGLFVFGPALERFFGAKRFVAFYLITGLGAGLLYSGINFYEVRQVQLDAERYIENPDPDLFLNYVNKHGKFARTQLYDFIDEYSANPENEDNILQSQEYAQQIFEWKANTPMVGASGAIFGILMAFGLIFPNIELMLLFFPFPIKAKYLVTFYGLYELYAGVHNNPGDNVAHFAHIGGMLFAFLLIKFWQKQGTLYR